MTRRTLFGSSGQSSFLNPSSLLNRTSLLAWCHSIKLRQRALLACAGLALAAAGLSTTMAQDVPTDVPPDPATLDSDTPSDVVFTDGDMAAWSGVVEPGLADGEVVLGPDGEPIPGHIIMPFYRNFMAADGEVVGDDGEIFWDGMENPLIYYSVGGGAPRTLLPAARTHNQIHVATALDALSGNTNPNTQFLIDSLNLLPAGQQRRALDSLSGETYGTLSSIGLKMGDRSLRTVSNRLINNGSFLAGGDGMLLGQAAPLLESDGGDQVLRSQSPVYGAAGWTQGFGGSGGWAGNGNAAGANYRLSGFAYGADLAGDDTGVIGLTGGHGYSSFHTDRKDNGTATSHQVGLYLLKNFESFYGLSVVNYSRNHYDVTRLITIGPIAQLAASKSSGNQFGSYSEAGMNLDTMFVRIQPFVGLQHLSVSNGSVFESPAGGAGLNVRSHTVNALQTHLGARAVLEPLVSSSGIEVRPYVSGRWVADLLGSNQSTTASFAGDPAGASWVVTGNKSGRHMGQVGPGVNVKVADGVSLFGNYDYQFGDRFDSHSGSGGVLFEF